MNDYMVIAKVGTTDYLTRLCADSIYEAEHKILDLVSAVLILTVSFLVMLMMIQLSLPRLSFQCFSLSACHFPDNLKVL